MRQILLAALPLLACVQPAEAPACPEGEVQDERSGECVAETCGSGEWGLLERNGDTIHVAPWGDDGGDGSEASPFLTIQSGADKAGVAGGAMVAVAAGSYLENLALDNDHDGIVIAGRCRDLVTLDGSPEDQPGVVISQGAITLRDLTVTAGNAGVWVQASGTMGRLADVQLLGLSLAHNRRIGLLVAGAGASVQVDGGEVTGTEPDEDGAFGRGAEVEGGAAFSATDLLLDGNHDVGLFVADAGTTVVLQATRILGTRPRPAGTWGRGVSVQDGAAFSATDLLLDGNHEVGLTASDPGTTVLLQGARILSTQVLPDGTLGRGVGVQDGAAFSATDLLLEGNSQTGLYAADAGTTVVLHGARIQATQALPDGTLGRGVGVQDGAAFSATDLVLEGNHDVGILALHAGTTVVLDGAVILGTQSLPGGTGGRVVEVRDGVALTATDLLVEANQEVGLLAVGSGTTVALNGARILGTESLPDGTFGQGVQLSGGVQLTATDLLLEGNHDAGLFAENPGTTVVLQGVQILDTQPLPDGTFGRGLSVQDGAALSATDLLLQGNHQSGLFAANPGTTVVLHGARILDTQPLPDGTFGRGVSVQDGAALSATELVLEGNHDVGVFAEDPGTLVDLVGATVAGTRSAPDAQSGVGLFVQLGASLTASGIAVLGNDGPGAYVVVDGVARLTNLDFDGNAFAGAVVMGGALTLLEGSISGSVLRAGEGGGVGVFAWDSFGAPALHVDGVAFSDLPGPALYLHGPGRFVMADCEVSGAGSWPSLPGGVLAVGGTGPWDATGGPDGLGEGLLLQGNTFVGLLADAILLDGSSATLAPHPDTGAANGFSDLAGEPLFSQRCGDAADAEIQDGSPADPSCRSGTRALGPLLEYTLWLTETDPMQ